MEKQYKANATQENIIPDEVVASLPEGREMPVFEEKVERPVHEVDPQQQAHMGWPWVRKALMQAALLLILGGALGVVSEQIRGSKIAWVASWSQKEVTAKNLEGLQEISPKEAWEAHRAGKAIFLDARDPWSFASGHLPGAINVPVSEVETYFDEISALEQAGLIPVAYCDGADCPLGAELARALREKGVKDVRVLVNGWSLWRDSGYPVEQGKR
ncbi:MAG: rhodanese-like domain-containing protein [bacterium]